MAVDTRNKRSSCLGFANPPFRVFPNPDGSIANELDHAHMAYCYAGITVEVGVVTTYPQIFLVGAIQRNVMRSGTAQRSIRAIGAAQRNVGLTGDRGANAL